MSAMTSSSRSEQVCRRIAAVPDVPQSDRTEAHGRKLVYASPRITEDDDQLFPNLEKDRWQQVSHQAGDHKQDASVLNVRPNWTPEVLKAGILPSMADRVRTLRLQLDPNEDMLPEWMDAISSTFFKLEHMWIEWTPQSEEQNTISNRMRRLYIIYRLPTLLSVDGINVAKEELELARPNDPNGQRVDECEWVPSEDGSSDIDDRQSDATLNPLSSEFSKKLTLQHASSRRRSWRGSRVGDLNLSRIDEINRQSTAHSNSLFDGQLKEADEPVPSDDGEPREKPQNHKLASSPAHIQQLDTLELISVTSEAHEYAPICGLSFGRVPCMAACRPRLRLSRERANKDTKSSKNALKGNTATKERRRASTVSPIRSAEQKATSEQSQPPNSTSPSAKIRPSESLSSPFPMQFRRPRISPQRHQENSTKEARVDDQVQAPRVPEVAIGMGTISNPIPLSRVLSSPSRLAVSGSSLKASDRPPPCPGGPKRIVKMSHLSPLRTHKAKQMLRQRKKARSTSVFDEDDDDLDECSSDEDYVIINTQQ